MPQNLLTFGESNGPLPHRESSICMSTAVNTEEGSRRDLGGGSSNFRSMTQPRERIMKESRKKRRRTDPEHLAQPKEWPNQRQQEYMVPNQFSAQEDSQWGSLSPLTPLFERAVEFVEPTIPDLVAYKNAFDLVEPTSPDPVVYKIRYKDSQFDVHWQQQRLGEENYDKIKVTDSDSVLEMRKDVFTGERAEAGDELKIASIIDETMTIHSPYLIDIMPEIVGYYPCSKSSGWKVRAGHRSLTLSKPYRMLGGARPKLGQLKEKYKEDIANGICNGRDSTEDFKTESITINHIERLEHELDKVLETPVMLEKKGYLQTPPVASFDMLWLLFRPGTEVCTIINGNLVCCRVLNPFWDILQAGEVDSATRVTLELRMWFLDFNGTHVDRRSHCLTIDSFEGKRNILDLEAYPVEYMRDKSLLQTMIGQGKKYMKFLQRNAPQCQYKGFVFTTQDGAKEMKERHFYDGRVVVDPVFHYVEYGPPYDHLSWLDKTDVWRSETNDGSMNKFVNLDPKNPNLELEDSHYVLLCRYLRGFTLGTRKWVWLHVDFIEECNPNTEMIEGLAIDPETLIMIKAFVPQLGTYQRGQSPHKQPVQIDPIAGKGEGQIMLLHGPPGTGKTFTTECMAEFSGRALLRLSAGELGLDPTQLETKLWRWFRMAEEWQAVLLIDEADVYLQQRGLGGSLEREAIVAVFLRALEYYRGILFLTSNCVGKFDDAITSRISLVIEFKNLTPEEKKKLRILYERKIREDKEQRYMLWDDACAVLKEIDDTTDFTYNGREIKNVFQMAIALATQQAGARNSLEETSGVGRISIRSDHIRMVMKSIENFINYQKHETGASREKIANDDGRRHKRPITSS